MVYTEHPTSQHAWEWINEYLACEESKVKANGGYRKGPQMISYDHFMDINKSWVNPKFDFAYIFGYKMAKWTKLISNYIDMDFLDIVKSQVQERESKKQSSYTVVFKFSNKHSSGHACLISIVFQRRDGYDQPFAVVSIRSSEVTKRLLMDFVLVDQIIKYVYGDKQSVYLKVHIINAFIAGETFSMYHNHKDLYKLLGGNKTEMARRIIAILDKYSNKESLTSVKYKSHLRAVKRLHKQEIAPLLASDLLLVPKPKVIYPDDILTDRERGLYRKKLKK